jgi:hypothetical protein
MKIDDQSIDSSDHLQIESAESIGIAYRLGHTAHASFGAIVSAFHRDGEVDLLRPVRLEPAVSIPTDIPVFWRGASIVFHAALQADAKDPEVFRPKFAIEITRNGQTSRYAIKRDSFTPDCPGHEKERPRIEVTPFGLAGSVAGILASWHEKTCGMHGSSDTDHLLLIDLRSAKPRATELAFSEIELWGYANGGVLRRDESTTCRWTGDDFDCRDALTVEAPWHPIEYVRRFQAFAGRRLSPAPNVVSLSDLPHVLDREVIVDGVGPLRPVAHFPNGVVLCATVEEDARLTATFYLVHAGRVTKVVARDLIEEKRYGAEKVPAIRFTRIRDGVTFRSSVLRRRGKAQLLRVVEGAGTERALFWVAVDPETSRAAALRVAGTAAEGEWRERHVPPSLLRYRFRDDGTASVVFVKRWVDDVFDGVRCRGEARMTRIHPCPMQSSPGRLTASTSGTSVTTTAPT